MGKLVALSRDLLAIANAICSVCIYGLTNVRY